MEDFNPQNSSGPSCKKNFLMFLHTLESLQFSRKKGFSLFHPSCDVKSFFEKDEFTTVKVESLK